MKPSMRPPRPGQAWPLFGLTLTALIATASSAAPTLPTGGKVVAGSAAIAAPKGGTLTIDQTSSRAIIDWTSFSIGTAGQVVFDNGSGATLNRVTGNEASLIGGRLTASGGVYLINPRGVIIGRYGVVKVGGTFAASTLDVTDAQFIAGGDLTFAGASGAAVVNYGRIGALGGDVALIAARVDNAGSIEAAKGAAGLIAGYRVLLRDKALNDGKFAVLLGGSRTSATNSGVIKAADAELRANGGNVYALAGNTGGIISATGVKAGDGKVWLVAEDGTLDVAGTIEARGAKGSAGAIETSGQTVTLGAAAIGAHGGTWLLDPTNLEITPAAATTISTSLATSDVTEQTTDGGNITLDAGAVIAWTSSHALTLQAANDLTLNGTISLSAGTLNLTAGGSIAANAPVTVSGAGTVDLAASGSGATLGLSFGNGASIDYGATDNGGKLSINGQAYTLLYKLSDGSAAQDSGTDDIAGIANNTGAGALNGHYALATDVTQASGVVYNSAPVQGYFNGVFEGLGNTITGFTVDDPSNGDRAGLFWTVSFGSPTVRDLGLVGGSVALTGTGSFRSDGYVGGIAGGNNGVLVNDFDTGAVSGGPGCSVGGLVGDNFSGAVMNSYTTGPISGGAGAGVGGVVGTNTSGSSVIDSYATGAVSGGSGAYLGGLVGRNDSSSTVSHGFATGPISGGEFLDGLVYNQGGTVTDGYYDADTTGQPLGAQPTGSVGLTTAALKASLPAGFSTSVWGQNPGVTYPYLLSFFPTGPTPQQQTLSGYAYSGLAGGVLADVTVDVILNGVTVLGSATTGSNGYYSITLPAGTLTPGATVVAYLAGTSVLADSAADDIAGASLGGLNLYGGALFARTPDTSLSALATGLAAGLGSATAAAGSDIIFGVSGGVLSVKAGDGLYLTSTGAGFDFNHTLSLGAGVLELTTAGPVTQTAGTITAGVLEGSSNGALALTAAGNQIASLGAFTSSGGAVTLADAGALAITGVVNAGAGAVTISDAGTITETGAGAIEAASFTGGAVGGASLGGANLIGSITGFTNSGAGGFALTDGEALALSGAIAAGSGALTLTTTGTGQGLSDGAALTGGGAIMLDASGPITITQAITLPGAQTLTLSSAGAIAVNAPINVSAAGTVNLTAAYDTTTAPGKSLLELTFGNGASIDYGPTDNGGALSINGQAYALLYKLSDSGTGPDDGTDDIAGIDHAGDDGFYALATNLTQASGSVFTGALAGVSHSESVRPTDFNGVFEGLGHTITVLTINDPTDVYVGLFGSIDTNAVIRDLGLVGGSVTGVSYAYSGVGDLVGGSGGGLLVNDYATGAVSVSGPAPTSSLVNSPAVGGLLGVNYDAYVVNSYASGTVSTGPVSYAGGLVGWTGNGGHIVDSYATGAVIGGAGNDVGGLLGCACNGDAVIDGYAAGAVSGGSGSSVGGLIGGGGGGSVIDGFYDADTTGQPLGAQGNGSVGLTTAALKASLPAGFSTAVWGQQPGVTYPYLLNLGPTVTPPQEQELSGYAYSSLTGGALAGVTVDAVLNGVTVLGSATTGANGFYSIFVPAGTLTPGATVVTYLAGTGALADSAADDIAGASLGGLNLYGGALFARTPDLSLSALATGLAAGLGSATTAVGSDIIFGVTGGVLSVKAGDSLYLTATGAGFAFNQTLNLGAGVLELATAGPVTQTAGAITVGVLEGSSSGALALTAAGNQIASISGFATSGGDLTLADAGALAITGAVNAGSGAVTISGAGAISETGTGAIQASSFGGSAVGGASLTGANQFATLGAFANTGGGDVMIADGVSLAITGAVNAGSGALTLQSSGTLSESGSGALIAASFTGGSVGGATLNQSANQFATLTSFTNTGGGNVEMADAGDLAITGPLSTGSGAVTIADAGTITETGAGAIQAAGFGGGSVGGASLGGANQFASLGAFTNTGGGNVAIADGNSLVVAGAVNAGTGALSLETSGTLTESAAGSLLAASFTSSSVGGATLNRSANQFAALADFSNTGGGNLTIADGSSLAITGAVNAGPGVLTLQSSGVLSQTASGALVAATFTGDSAGGATLAQSANQFATFTGFTNTGGGNVAIADGSSLVIAGAINAGSGALTLQSSGVLSESASGALVAVSFGGGSVGGATLKEKANAFASFAGFINSGGGDVTIADRTSLSIIGLVDVGASTLRLSDAGSISESGAGAIDARALAGAGVGGVALNGANMIGYITDALTNSGTGGLALTDGEGLIVNGAISAGAGDLSLTTTGVGQRLFINAHLTAQDTIALNASGLITEWTPGALIAAGFTGSSVGGASLNQGANRFAALLGFTDTGGGYVTIADGSNLAVTGLVDVGAAILRLGDAGTISQSGAGAIDARVFGGGSVGGASLTGANLIGHLTGFDNGGTGDFALTDGEALTVTGPLTVNSGAITLATTAGNLAVHGPVSAGAVTLDTAGRALESAAGAIDTGLLNVTAAAGIVLTSKLNAITTIGTNSPGTGPDKITQ